MRRRHVSSITNPAPDPDSESWRDLAACLDTDPMLFFPTHGTSMGPGKAAEQREAAETEARATCGRCPVADLCLEEALAEFDSSYDFGIRGGTDPAERAEIRKVRSVAC